MASTSALAHPTTLAKLSLGAQAENEGVPYTKDDALKKAPVMRKVIDDFSKDKVIDSGEAATLAIAMKRFARMDSKGWKASEAKQIGDLGTKVDLLIGDAGGIKFEDAMHDPLELSSLADDLMNFE